MTKEFSGRAPQGQIFNQTIPAGQTIPLQQSGNNAYVRFATAQILMRARGRTGTNVYNPCVTGEGIENTEFETIEIQNPNAFDVITSIWVGEAGFIDKKLILSTQFFYNVVRPLYTDPTHAPAASVAIDDISGGAFFDINGKKWLAVSRVQILISNLDLVNLILLQKFGNAVWNTGAVFAVQPETEVGPAFGGSYTLVQNGGVVNALVTEVYQSIPA